MELTKEQIRRINEKCPYEQGVFMQPSMVPTDVKELVIYMQWDSYGWSGGSCWGDKPEYYEKAAPDFIVLDEFIREVKPTASYLEVKDIEKLIQTANMHTPGYYGNRNTYECKYILVSEALKVLGL